VTIHPPTRDRFDGYFTPFFKKDDAVTVLRKNSASACTTALDEHHLPLGTEVTLVRWDRDDNTWLVGYDNASGGYNEVWIFQDCLEGIEPLTEEDVEDAIASIKMGMHPDLLRMLAYEEEAIAQGYKDGDVNHYIQPIIGILRMKLQDNQLPDREFLEYAVDRMLKACKAETAWLKARERER
jgi:hypothetical protein